MNERANERMNCCFFATSDLSIILTVRLDLTSLFYSLHFVSGYSDLHLQVD